MRTSDAKHESLIAQNTASPAFGVISSRQRRAWAVSLSGLFTFGASILYRFPPETHGLYPRCPVQEFLHIECPGCGATRAFAALLHGNLVAALHFNAFAVLVILPLVATYIALCFNRLARNERFQWPSVPRPIAIALAVLAAAFTLFRNA